jgi:hypothetical protein
MLMGLPVRGSVNAPHFISMFQDLTESLWRLDGHLFVKGVWPVLEPMVWGSFVVGGTCGLLVYFLVLPVLTSLKGRTKPQTMPPV